MSGTAIGADKLVYMVNQIARNLAMRGDAAAVSATAQHIRDYWDPRMKAAILAHEQAGLDPIASAAIRQLAADETAVAKGDFEI